jgi:hypothetical protein
MEKQLGNSGKRKKPIRPKPAHQTRPCTPVAPKRWTPPVSASLPRTLLSLSRSLPSGAKLSALVPFARAPSSLSASRARFTSRRAIAPCARPLSAPRSSPISSSLPALAVDQRARTRARCRNSRPRRSPTRPSSLFEPRSRPHSLPRLISHSPALSRALPTPSDLTGDPHPPPRSTSSPEAMPSNPELHLEVRHLLPCSISPFTLCHRPISASPVSAVVVRRALTGAGRFSPA